MKYVLYPLIILMFMSMINLMYLFLPLGTDNFNTAAGTYSNAPQQTQVNINGNPQNYTTQGQNFSFGIDLQTGIIAILVVAVVGGAISGISILGSGLNATSSMIIFKSSLFFMLWAFFSILSIGLFMMLPVFGMVIWLAMTLIYGIGIIQSIGFGGA